MIEINYYSLGDASLAHGVVVVIDVLRAFTTAAFAFHSGAKEIYPVASVEDALALKARIPGSLVMGEVDGYKPEGFDFSNSPADIQQADLHNRSLVQRTSAGTQGIIRAVNADRCYAASFVVAKATAERLRAIKPSVVSFLVTGKSLGRDGDEDLACGEYIETLFNGSSPDPTQYIGRVLTSSVGRDFQTGQKSYLLAEDLALSTRVNEFNFFLQIHKRNNLSIIRKGTLEQGLF